MTVPDFQTIMLPLLRLTQGGDAHLLRDCTETLAQYFSLSQEERRQQVPRGGSRLFDYRVRWARQYLVEARLLDSPERGALRITKRGTEVLAQSPPKIDRTFLRQFPEFVQFLNARKPTRQEPTERRGPPRRDGETQGRDRPPATLAFSDAAEYVLEHHAGRKPMHYRALTAKALELGLVGTQGQTPDATLNAQIGSDIERRRRRGEGQRFIRHGQGLIGLVKWTGEDGLAVLIDRHNARARKELLARLGTMPPIAFEAVERQLDLPPTKIRTAARSRVGCGIASRPKAPRLLPR